MNLDDIETGDTTISTESPQQFLQDIVEISTCGKSQNELYENCLFNARRVYELLEHVECDPRLVRGGTQTPTENPNEESNEQMITTCEENGVIHWWIEVLINNDVWIVDVASEHEPKLKQTIISTDYPQGYTVLTRDPKLPPLTHTVSEMLNRHY